ncbi:hypothetical protein HHK36_008920 [Tetracentron sinense]|uniref:Helicase ATP-binding domain-containing protein n=1 Tax=Tetracentron sinense TaxID=13715 RepID=A0A835DGZ5_TETSI|nr:hypothetical protein HHK36_008920 [Tetracentron sinense]
MAEKKPMSLNQRHNRLLKDISSQSRSTKAPLPDEDKPLKIKLEGRRRLCKISSRDHDGEDPAESDVPRFSGITDFDSPPGITDFDSPPAKNIIESSGNEVRDILNELTSRLEFLSIEKRRVPPKSVEPSGDLSNVFTNEVPKQQGAKADVVEYTSAASSFSLTPDRSDSSSDAASLSRDGRGIETRVENYRENADTEGDNFITRVNPVKEIDKGQVNNDMNRMDGKFVSIGHSSFSTDYKDDDDFLVLSSKESGKEGKGRAHNYKEESSDVNVVDLSDDSRSESFSKDEGSIILSGPTSTYKLPSKIAKILYPHQRDGLKWLWSLHCRQTGGILGDDMGLGKTMQMCSFLAGLFHSCLIKRALIVAPKTLLSHWIKELSAMGLAEKTREYFGTCVKTRQYELQYILQDKGVLLTTYDIVRNNSKSLSGDCYFRDERSEDSITWDYIILDEGHLIKNPSTQRAKSLLEIPSAHRIIISGTPIQNNLKELWALFSFCCPELLGDKKEFKDRYESAILRGNDKNASDREKRIGSTVAKALRERIEPYFLRRLKSEVFHENEATKSTLSKKNEMIVWLKLTRCQRQLYEAFLKSELVLSAFDGSPLAALTVLLL